MKFFCRLLFIQLFCFAYLISFSQTDTCRLRISLLTCGPGEELYSTFGHTAIRVTDSSNRMDIVFNYGTFDDSDPYFYVKFTRGIMRYALSAEAFSDFMQEYISDKRSVTEQVLLLSCTEKSNLFSALKENAKEENRYYNYHFHTDNCTTRAKDIIKKCTNDPITFKNILPAKIPTFRQLIHNYLDSSNHSWDKFGIDLLMGSHLDVQATNEQAMFLPDYLMTGIDSALCNQEKLISSKQIILAAGNKSTSSLSWFTPFIFFTSLCFIFIAISFSKAWWAQKMLNVFDPIFFLLIGLLGMIMAFVWLGRVDNVCANNLNILWAWPTHVVMAFLIKRKTRFIKNYFRVTALIAIIILIFWVWVPQQLNIAFAPLLILIITRSIFISKKI